MNANSEIVDELDAIEQDAWNRLNAAITSHRAAFHSGYVATAGVDGQPQVRTVILRAADQSSRTLAFHTDLRSPKFAELSAEPRLSWLFYDEPSRMQLRTEGAAKLHTADTRADRHWAATSLDSRRAYAAEAAPSSPLLEPGNGLSAVCTGKDWTLAASEQFRPNFCVVVTEIRRMEVLVLRHQGHRRAAFDYDANGLRRSARWLIP